MCTCVKTAYKNVFYQEKFHGGYEKENLQIAAEMWRKCEHWEYEKLREAELANPCIHTTDAAESLLIPIGYTGIDIIVKGRNFKN